MTRSTGPLTRAGTVLAVGALALGLGACGSKAPTGAGIPAAAGKLPVASPTASPTPKTYTTSDLRALLLGETDLPSTYSVDTSSTDTEDSGITSPTRRCDALADIINETSIRDASVEADVSFDGGEDSSYLTEDLAVLPTADAAKAYVGRVRDAVNTCDRLRAESDGDTISLRVSTAPAPSVGDDKFALELSVSDGETVFAFDVHLVTSGSIVLVTTGDDATEADMTAFTGDAFAKLTGKPVPPHGHVKGDARSGGSSGGSGGSGSGGSGSGGSGSGGSGSQPA